MKELYLIVSWPTFQAWNLSDSNTSWRNFCLRYNANGHPPTARARSIRRLDATYSN